MKTRITAGLTVGLLRPGLRQVAGQQSLVAEHLSSGLRCGLVAGHLGLGPYMSQKYDCVQLSCGFL